MSRTHIVLFVISALLIAAPALAAASSVVSSLIQGKSTGEAINILAGQINTLIGRVEQVEQTQVQIQDEINQVQQEVSDVQASTTANTETVQEELDAAKAELSALKEEIDSQQVEQALKLQEEQEQKYCEDLSIAKLGGGTGNIVRVYEKAVMQSSPETNTEDIDGLKIEYETSLARITSKTPIYSDFMEEDRQAYCSDRERLCELDENECMQFNLDLITNPEIKKCAGSLQAVRVYEDYQEELDVILDPSNSLYSHNRETAARLKPQYEKYMAECN